MPLFSIHDGGTRSGFCLSWLVGHVENTYTCCLSVIYFCFHHVWISLPSEVCTVISDADCITPVETVCNAATPSPDCQMILRQFFNDSGVFCINVSLTNDVSLAVASARVSVTVGGWMQFLLIATKIISISDIFSVLIFVCLTFEFSASGGSPAGTAATILGVMVLACVVCCVGLMYRRVKHLLSWFNLETK